jgi:hypothetical protein
MSSACMEHLLFFNDFSLDVQLRTDSTAAIFHWVSHVACRRSVMRSQAFKRFRSWECNSHHNNYVFHEKS